MLQQIRQQPYSLSITSTVSVEPCRHSIRNVKLIIMIQVIGVGSLEVVARCVGLVIRMNVVMSEANCVEEAVKYRGNGGAYKLDLKKRNYDKKVDQKVGEHRHFTLGFHFLELPLARPIYNE